LPCCRFVDQFLFFWCTGALPGRPNAAGGRGGNNGQQAGHEQDGQARDNGAQDDPDGDANDNGNQNQAAGNQNPAAPINDPFLEELGIGGLHELADAGLFGCIVSVDLSQLTPEEQALTDAEIFALLTKSSTAQAKKCVHTFINRTTQNIADKAGVSTTGSKVAVQGRLLAYFAKLREQDTVGAVRPFSNSATWSEPATARLIEVFVDRRLYQQLSPIYEFQERRVLDARHGGNLIDQTFDQVVAVAFNNFTAFQPDHPFPDVGSVLHHMDPNHPDIPRRTGAFCRSHFTQWKTWVTALENNYS